jgi:hypothetical protein
LQRKLLIAFASSLLLTPSLFGQQKLLSKRHLATPVPAPAPVTQPAVPLPPEQMPASPPEVQFQQGQLTISASNSTLGDILRAVHKETGASIDVPGNATERVVGQFGPGPARDVLASLLNGSHFNYVLLGSSENFLALDRVILTSKSSATGMTVQQASAAPPQYQPGQPVVAPPPADSDDTATEDAAPDQPDSADADDQANANEADDQQQQQPNSSGQAGGVKTPEQLLQELQQRQQQMQQQGVPNPPTPGLPRSPQ